ncbi:MAG: XylR N-terminal domain-containing protein, partial [Myxococcota bacterium]
MAFAERRALLLDAQALGHLRHELVKQLGWTAARAILLRMGFAHGHATAEANRTLDWEAADDWRRAGGRFHRLQGLVDFQPVPAEERAPDALAEALWHDSYEAEQHLAFLGRSDAPVCWTLTGFASGYLNAAFGAEPSPILCLETRCVAQGDAVCRMVGKRLHDWGDEILPIAAALEHESLDAILDSAAAE